MTTQRKLGDVGGSVTGDDELEQSLVLLVTTRQQSVPHCPQLGSLLFELLDEPQPVVTAKAPLLVRRAASADPRLIVDGVSVGLVRPGNLELVIRWHPARGGAMRETRVTVS